MSIEAMIREFASEQGLKPPTFLAQALRDEAAFYERHVPFQVGDLVTPRKATTYSRAGEACIVIAVLYEQEYDLGLGEIGSTHHGNRFDMRVLRWVKGAFAPFWVESAAFEAWVDPHTDVTASASGTDKASA